MQKRILVTALDWGLGHASRSIPIIRLLLEQGVEVFLASDGRAAKLLEVEFPDLHLAELPSYNIQYPSSNLTWHLSRQLPRVWKAIRQENKTTKELTGKWGIDGIISDHRYGCYDQQTPSAFVCHQMKILAPNILAQWFINQAHRFFLRNFDQHWIPDLPDYPGLGGKLSHGFQTSRSKFIGPLSRMERKPKNEQWNYLVILSGPEPQRTYLETEIVESAKSIPGKWLIIGGKTEDQEDRMIQSNIFYRSFLDSMELENVINSSRIVICRSGYSSIMDLNALEKQAVLIPTQGQSEQIYLAELHGESKQFVIAQQGKLELERIFKELAGRTGKRSKKKDDLLLSAVQEFLDQC